MTEYSVKFDQADQPVQVSQGTILTDAAGKAGIEIAQPCGGQGRCGRCAVIVEEGKVRRRSTLRLSANDIAQGYALACQTVVESDCVVRVPPQEQVKRHLTTDRQVADITVPAGYDPAEAQTLRRVSITLVPPSMEDQTDDWSRLEVGLRQEVDFGSLHADLAVIRKIGPALRAEDWKVTAILHSNDWSASESRVELIDLFPGLVERDHPLWGVAVDIGTTTVSTWLVNLLTGEVRATAAEYNGQISRGDDIISRIIFASKEDGDKKLQSLVLETIEELLDRICQDAGIDKGSIYKMTIAGNSTMMHLLLDIPASSIRLSPFVTVINHLPLFPARELGLGIHPAALIDALPGVASYVGADISAGVLSSGLDDADQVTLFLDVGTNGETVLGSKEWLVTCACSAGPAFEGSGVIHGMRATTGAIDDVWINSEDYEPTWNVIGNKKPRGLCGSALISLLAEMFMTGVINKSGGIDITLDTERTRKGSHGGEYVVAWAQEAERGEDIVITDVDIDNLIRTKAAIFAGFTVLADSVGVPLEMVEQVLIGGAFGKYINVEKAIQIGLLPDMDWDKFKFLGNTSIKGAYQALLDRHARARVADIANRMTYVELSADNRFYDAFTSAMFLPHTDMSLFPSVQENLQG
ncbi:MAG: ASKHA domain-containing protein [Anaerolineales bacterium]|nr:ASKHA domain-containing protein [Anaerolineales bacterium]